MQDWCKNMKLIYFKLSLLFFIAKGTEVFSYLFKKKFTRAMFFYLIQHSFNIFILSISWSVGSLYSCAVIKQLKDNKTWTMCLHIFYFILNQFYKNILLCLVNIKRNNFLRVWYFLDTAYTYIHITFFKGTVSVISYIPRVNSIKIGLLPPHNFPKIWYENKRHFSKLSSINLISNFKQNLIEDYYQ